VYSYLGIQNLIGELKAPLDTDDTSISLRADVSARICAALSNGSHTYLAIEAPGAFEIVKATCSQGVVLIERGQDGTAPTPFPLGACVRFILAGAAIEDIIDQYDPCPRPCNPAVIKAGATAPNGQVGIPYEHVVVLGGTAPFRLGQIYAPDWMAVTLEDNTITFSGTPTVASTQDVSVAFGSCGNIDGTFHSCVTVAA
jgi:hypothetical protein